MRTYWNISLSRNTGNSFETLIHFANVPIAGVHHAEDISDMNKKEITYLAQCIAKYIIEDIRDTYRTFSVDNIAHCSLGNVIILDGAVTNEFKDRLQMLVNKEVQKGKSLSAVFESTLEKYSSSVNFANHMEDTEGEANFIVYDTDDLVDHILQEAGRTHKHAKWGLLLVDVYTGTLTEVTVEAEQDNTLDNVLDKYLENGFECVTKKRLMGLPRDLEEVTE